VWGIKFLRRGHAIDAAPARWRGDAGSSPLDRARTAASSPRNGTAADESGSTQLTMEDGDECYCKLTGCTGEMYAAQSCLQDGSILIKFGSLGPWPVDAPPELPCPYKCPGDINDYYGATCTGGFYVRQDDDGGCVIPDQPHTMGWQCCDP